MKYKKSEYVFYNKTAKNALTIRSVTDLSLKLFKINNTVQSTFKQFAIHQFASTYILYVFMFEMYVP